MELYTFSEAASRLRIPESTLRRWVAAGKVAHHRLGRLVASHRRIWSRFPARFRRGAARRVRRAVPGRVGEPAARVGASWQPPQE
jgi:excisionase family DNA binding protein